MHYCRPAVEKFVFNRLYGHLFAMYCIKTKALDDAFQLKVEVVPEKSVEDLLLSLDIREKYRLSDLAVPYANAIETLKKLGSYSTPLEKLNCCLNTSANMKTAVIDYWKGREELDSMDDELPLLIFVIYQARVPNINAEVALLLDYIGRSSRFEKEQRLLINFEAAAKYIANEWDM